MTNSRRALAGAALAVLAIAAVGCGDDDAPPPQRPVQPTPTSAATSGAAGGPGGKNLLAEKIHIEERVVCPIPDKPSDPSAKCDLKAPSCAEHLYCLKLPQGSFCEPCPERDAIRHAFKERDFAAEQNRDPFQSLILPIGPLPGAAPALTKKCPREEQLVATGYSYTDLKLVGIVAEGAQRKVLMMGGPLGYIIKRGDCVGKEKAVVKDIGLGYVTFQVDPDEYSVQLNPRQLMVNEPELPPAAPRTTITPVVPPPAVLPPRGPGGGGVAGSGAGTAAGSAAATGKAGAPPAAGSGSAAQRAVPPLSRP